MPVPESRATERTAVNKVRLLLERHGHIVHEIDGGSDFGEDLLLSIVQGHERTGISVAIQVKGGVSYRSAVGYAVKVRQHAREWMTNRMPVVCVVYDPELRALFWANASAQLTQGGRSPVRSISIREEAVLNDKTVRDFITQMVAFSQGWDPATSRGKEALGVNPAIDAGPIGGGTYGMVAPAARWFETRIFSMGVILVILLSIVFVAVWAIMIPAIYEFASEYVVSVIPPWMWVFVVVGYTNIGFGLMIWESCRYSKFPGVSMYAAVFLPVFLAYGAWMADAYFGLPAAGLRVLAALIPQAIRYLLLFGSIYYILRELRMRRRLRALSRDPDDLPDVIDD